ncbi:hypothetical protein BDV12DRAFT_203241 [Aspergillus spectabilis]
MASAQEAMKALNCFVNEDTILVVHAGHVYLPALGVVHLRIVDTRVLTKEAVKSALGVGYPDYDLKITAKEVAKMDLHETGLHENRCEEAAYGVREILLVYYEKLAFDAWCIGKGRTRIKPISMPIRMPMTAPRKRY